VGRAAPACLAALMLAGAGVAAAQQGAPRARRVAHGEGTPCDTGPGLGAMARGVNCRTLMVDGYPREYIVYVPTDPSFDLEAPTPVVFMFHGSSGDGPQYFRISGWREKADAEGFVAVFPTAVQHWVLDTNRFSTKWNGYKLAGDIDLAKRPPGYPAEAPWPADDIGFTRAMLGDLEANLAVDTKRVYMTGFSNGGQFTSRVAIELSDVVAAAAAAAGTLGGVYEPVERIPFVFSFGVYDDRFYEAFGVTPPITRDVEELLAIPEMQGMLFQYLTSFDLAFEPYQAVEAAQYSAIRWETPDPAGDNPGGNELVCIVFNNVAHVYPNGVNNPHGFTMTDILWPFFTDHPKP